MLRVLQVAAPTPAGGLERVVESLAVGLHRRGHEVIVATLLHSDERDHPFVEALSAAGVPVRMIHVSARDYLRERKEIARLCRDVSPQVVHLHGYRVDLLHRSVVAKQGLPAITTVHGASRMGGVKGAFLEWLQRRNYRRFDGVIAVSADLYDTTVRDGVPEARLHLIRNARSRAEALPPRVARERLSIDHGVAVVGWVGRLIPVKGADIFLEALARMPEPRPTAVLIGYGPEAQRLRKQSEDLGLDTRVHFRPDIHDAARYFKAFDTFVLSSRSEGLPIVILEAMAASTPVVATRVGGVGEAVGRGAGWLVSPEDPEALACAIAESLRDRARAEAQARLAKERLESEYGLDAFLDSHENVYRALAAASNPPRAEERSGDP